MPSTCLSSGISLHLCTRFYASMWGHLFARFFPPRGCLLFSGPNGDWRVCINRIWHSRHSAWPLSHRNSVRGWTWDLLCGQGAPLGQESWGHQWDRREGILEELPAYSLPFSYLLLEASCVCANLTMRSTGIVVSRSLWVHVVLSSRIRYRPWCLCCCSVFAFFFFLTKYWHHAS